MFETMIQVFVSALVFTYYVTVFNNFEKKLNRERLEIWKSYQIESKHNC